MTTRTCNNCSKIYDLRDTAEMVQQFGIQVDSNLDYIMSDEEEAVYLGLYCLDCSNQVFIDKSTGGCIDK